MDAKQWSQCPEKPGLFYMKVKKSADKQMPPSDSMFLPITADFTLSHKETSDMLYGVCFTFSRRHPSEH